MATSAFKVYKDKNVLKQYYDPFTVNCSAKSELSEWLMERTVVFRGGNESGINTKRVINLPGFCENAAAISSSSKLLRRDIENKI